MTKNNNSKIEEKEKVLGRRSLLKNTFLATSASLIAVSASANEVCRLTAEQPKGPFYPENDQDDKNTDLTKVKGKIMRARGEVVILRGVVSDQNCRPVEGVLVEIWQACDTGKYNHSADPNSAKLDPNFQYWGQAITNKKGEYAFKTIKPGSYRATDNWVRPPHIHLKASLRGYKELITQTYFKDEKELNSKDRILKSLSLSDQKDAIIDFKKSDKSIPTGDFNISILRL